MTASVLKQDPNTKSFKRTLIYFNTDTQYAHFREILFIKPQNDTLQLVRCLEDCNHNKISLFRSFFIVFNLLSVV